MVERLPESVRGACAHERHLLDNSAVTSVVVRLHGYSGTRVLTRNRLCRVWHRYAAACGAAGEEPDEALLAVATVCAGGVACELRGVPGVGTNVLPFLAELRFQVRSKCVCPCQCDFVRPGCGGGCRRDCAWCVSRAGSADGCATRVSVS